MRNRSAQSYRQSQKIERRAERAAREAGKSVQEWLEDLILEQSPDEEHLAADSVQETMANLFERVQSLENEFDRRERDASRSKKRQDTLETDRVVGMLDTISFLEERLRKQATDDNAFSRESSQFEQTDDHEASVKASNRMKRLERQLKELEAALDQRAEESLIEQKFQGNGAFRPQNRRHGRSDPRARPMLDDASEIFSHRRRSRSTAPMSRGAAPRELPDNTVLEQHMHDLIQKVDDLSEQAQDPHDVDRLAHALSSDVKALRHELRDNENRTVENLRRAIHELREEISKPVPDSRLESVEADVNRIAEFLLKSPDLSSLPKDIGLVSRDIGKLAKELQTTLNRTETANRDQSSQLANQIDKSLSLLRNDIVAEIKAIDDDPSKTASAHRLEQRLAELGREIASVPKTTVDGKLLASQLSDNLIRLRDDIVSRLSQQKPDQQTTAFVNRVEKRLSELGQEIASIPKTTVDGKLLASQLSDNLVRHRDDIVSRLSQQKPDQQTAAFITRVEKRLSELGQEIASIPKTTVDGKLLASQLSDNLVRLRDDIVSRLSQEKPDEQTAAFATRVEQRLDGLNRQIEQATLKIAGHTDAIQAGLRSAAAQISENGAATPIQVPGPEVGKEIVEQFESQLGRLREDLLSEISKAPQADPVEPARNFEGMERQIDALRGTVEQSTKHIHDSLLGVETRVLSAAEKLEMLSKVREGGPEATTLLKSLENRLIDTVQRLEHASSDVLDKDNKILAEIEKKAGIDEEKLRETLNEATSRLSGEIQADHAEAIDHAARRTAIEITSLLNQGTDDATAEKSGIDALRKELDRLRSSTDGLSNQTKHSYEGMRSMLDQVVDRLDSMERKQTSDSVTAPESDAKADLAASPQNPAPRKPAVKLTPVAARKSVDSKPVDAIPLAESMVEDMDDSDEQAVFKQMQTHVKAREPEAPLLEPGPADQPLAPGSGRPPEGAFAAPNPSHDTKRQPQSDNEALTTKADFVAAARRAAQAAAAEHASLAMSESAEDKPSRVGMLSNRVKTLFQSPKDQKKSTQDDDAPSLEEEIDEPELVLGEEDAVRMPESLEDAELLTQSRKESPILRRALMGTLVVALIGVGALYLKSPLLALLGDESTQVSTQAPVLTTPLASDDTSPSAAANETAPNLDGPSVVTPAGQQATNTNAFAQPLPDPVTPPVDGALTTQSINDDPINAVIDHQPTHSISPDALLRTDDADISLFAAVDRLPPHLVTPDLIAALNQGNANAAFEMARRFSEGSGSDRDLTQAAYWYKQAAAQDHALAQFRLGSLYESGVGVRRDRATARQWYVRAAQNGNARAMHNLAVLHAGGAFGEPDFNEAYRWFKQAADFGITDSQFNLGILYVRGLGAQKNFIKAYKWLDITAKNGDQGAVERRDEIGKAMTENALQTARTLSAEWKKKPWITAANVQATPPVAWTAAIDATTTGSIGTGSETSSNATETTLIHRAQSMLNGLGFDAGAPDGIVGAKTRAAVQAFQYEVGIPQTGVIDEALVDLLRNQRI